MGAAAGRVIGERTTIAEWTAIRPNPRCTDLEELQVVCGKATDCDSAIGLQTAESGTDKTDGDCGSALGLQTAELEVDRFDGN